MMKRIGAFQMKGLRKISGKKSTYWDREAINENFLDQTNWLINQKEPGKNSPETKYKNWQRILKTQRQKRQKS